jgi:hypothetical protein
MASSITSKHYPFGDVPAGYDPNLARQLAQEVADNVRRGVYDYSRALVTRFQVAAGNDPDGIYGPYTVSTLQFYGVASPPSHLFKLGDEIPPYHPPVIDQEVTIDVPGPGGSTTVMPRAAAEGDAPPGAPPIQQAGFDMTSALAILGAAVSIGAGAIRGRYFSAPVPLAGHSRSSRGNRRKRG